MNNRFISIVLAMTCLAVVGCSDSLDGKTDSRILSDTGSETDTDSNAAVADTSDTASATSSNVITTDDTDSSDSCELTVGGELYSGVHVLRFGDDNGNVIYVQREWLDFGIGESSLYGLTAMVISSPGSCVAISDQTLLTYGNSHHNWMDTASGYAKGFQYDVVIEFSMNTTDLSDDFYWIATLTVTELSTSQQVGLPLILNLTGGPLFTP